jgi:hypothetical protein
MSALIPELLLFVVERRSTNAIIGEGHEEYPSDERLNVIPRRSEFPYLAAFLMRETPVGSLSFRRRNGWMVLVIVRGFSS